MISRTEPPQLNFLPANNLFPAINTVAPLHRHVAVSVGVYEHIEGVGARVELWEEGDAGGDLAEKGGDFGLNFRLGFFGGRSGCWVWCICGGGRGIFLVLGYGSRRLRGGFAARF